MSLQAVIRSYEAKVDDIKPNERAIIARIGGRSIDRHRSIIDPKGIDLEAYKHNPIVLWEHGRDPVRGFSPVGKNQWIKSDGDRLIAKTIFRDDAYSQELFKAYQDEWLRMWSVNVIAREASAPTREEIRAFPELESGCDVIYRHTELAEYSTVAIGSHREAVSLLISRGIWVPDEAKVEAEKEALNRTVVAMPGLPEPDAIARTTTDSEGGLAGGGATLKPGDDDDEDEDDADGKPKRKKKARPKDGESMCKSGVAAPQPVAKSGDGVESILRRIVEEDGKYFVLSDDGSKRLGGPYGSRGEAEKRLEQVEYFKHEDKGGERTAPEPEPAPARTAPYIDTDESTWTVRRPDGSAIAIYREAGDAEECLRMIESGASRPFERVLAEVLYEQRAAIDARQDDLIARIELEYFGRLGSDKSTR